MDPITIAMLGGAAIKGASGWFGANSAEKKLDAANAQARQDYSAGVRSAKDTINTSAQSQSGFISPYAEQGGRANEMYGNALGVNGQEAQRGFFDSFEDDPGFQATLDAGRNQIEHSNIVQGRSNSGAAMKELFGYGQRQKQSQFQDRLDRLGNLGGQGYQASTGLAGIEQNRGNTIAGLTMDKARFNANNSLTGGQIGADATAARWGSVGGMVDDMVSTYGRSQGMGGKTG